MTLAAVPETDEFDELRDARENPAPRVFLDDDGEPIDPAAYVGKKLKPVAIERARKVGHERWRWYLTLRSPEGDPTEVGPIDDDHVIDPRAMRKAIWRGARIVIRKFKEDDWGRIAEALDCLAEVEDDGHRDAEAWNARLLDFAGEDAGGDHHDPDDPDGKRTVITYRVGCFHDLDGRLWVHAGSLVEHLALKRVRVTSDEVAAALTRMGYANRQLTARIDGRSASRRYWHSPGPFEAAT